MKVVATIREIYHDRLPVYEKLKSEVDNFFVGAKKSRWHYESRVKSLKSFALKSETGRAQKISEMEDFFGACLVVENSSEIATAFRVLKERFEVAYRRPKTTTFTHKNPDSFVFDDLRLYLKIPHDPNWPSKGIEDVIFELQIKTFLQHAWSIATHEMVYKGDKLSWAASRIAFQVKAMLEHAELSIMESDRLSENFLVAKDNHQFKLDNKLLTLLKEKWPEEQLPDDLTRLASNIREFMDSADIKISELKAICEESRFIGDSPLRNISPYVAIALAAIESNNAVIERLENNNKRVFLPDEGMTQLSSELQAAVESVRHAPA